MRLSTTWLGFYEKAKGENSANEVELDSDWQNETEAIKPLYFHCIRQPAQVHGHASALCTK